MLENFPVALLAGVILGYLAGLGVGGGSLLILWLTLILGMPQGIARLINLLFFITAAGSVSIFRFKKGILDFKKLLPAIIAGCVAAGAFAWLGTLMDTGWLRKLFGLLLLFTGLRELFYRPRKAK